MLTVTKTSSLLLVFTISLFACSEGDSVLKKGECKNCITLKYGEEVAFRDGYKVKIEDLWDTRGKNYSTTLVYPGANFGLSLRVFSPTSDTTISISTAVYNKTIPKSDLEPLFNNTWGTNYAFGYKFAFYEILPVIENPEAPVALEDYIVTLAVRKE
jgi:hypothetical protein